MGKVNVALDTLKIVCQMRPMIDLVTRVLDHDIRHLVTLLTCPRVHFCSEERARVCTRDPFSHVARPIQMGTEFPYDAGLGMALDTVSLSVNGPGMG
jgi:hypothetical protein